MRVACLPCQLSSACQMLQTRRHDAVMSTFGFSRAVENDDFWATLRVTVTFTVYPRLDDTQGTGQTTVETTANSFFSWNKRILFFPLQF